MNGMDRRLFLQSIGSAGVLGALPAAAASGHLGGGHVIHEMAGQDAAALPTHPIKFAVCGMSHDHIYGMVGAIQRGGGVLVAAYGAEPDKIAAFKKRCPDVKNGFVVRRRFSTIRRSNSSCSAQSFLINVPRSASR